MLVVVQLLKNRVRDAADAHLEGGAVGDDRGEVIGDGFLFVG